MNNNAEPSVLLSNGQWSEVVRQAEGAVFLKLEVAEVAVVEVGGAVVVEAPEGEEFGSDVSGEFVLETVLEFGFSILV